MKDCRKFYINGAWVNPVKPRDFPVENPATEAQIATISLGSAEDVNAAVNAARAAFQTYSQTSREERLVLLRRLLDIYQARFEEMAQAISQEMGAPITFSRKAQADSGQGHLEAGIRALEDFAFEYELSHGARILREPIGVCGLITPWNWPINQIACKVVPALAAGCTLVLKPSEIAPLSAYLWSEMIHEAGFPAGVYNMVNGDGPGVGAAMSAHPDIDMMSFTGSTRAGIAVAKAAADSVKRVTQELGGKSPNLILAGADLEDAIPRGVKHCFSNTGQSCNAATRMLVPKAVYAQAVALAKETAENVTVDDSAKEGRHLGPLSSAMQFEKVQKLIQAGIDEGARLVVGGVGKPEGLDKGYFVKPSVFADVNNSMHIAREEIFGPVLVMIPYDTEEEAIAIANDTPYGLSAYVQSGDIESARRVARRLRAGMVHLNGVGQQSDAPFGGYKQSGNGREWGAFGFEDFLETKVVNGWVPEEDEG